MKSFVLYLVICMGFLSLPALGQSRYDPMPGKAHAQRKGFVEWLFSRHGPHGTDYGQKIEDCRREVLDSLGSADFWGQAIPWCWVAILLVLFRHKEKVREQRLIISARLTARIYNAYVDVRREALDAVRKYNELANSRAIIGSGAVPVPAIATVGPQKGGGAFSSSLPEGRPAAAQAGPDPRMNPGTSRPTARTQNEKKPTPDNRVANVDYIAQINILQGQLTASHETIERLQAEVDKLGGMNPQSGDKN